MELTPNPATWGKTLGIHWDTEKDTFYVAVPNVPVDRIPTKRFVASIAAKMFDCMGWFSPVMLLIHSFLQTLWSLNLDWDDPIPEEHLDFWQRWSSQLKIVANFPISRHVSKQNSPVVEKQLHLFSDASEKGYGGVVYLRARHQDTTISVTLLTSKARVTPIKKQTIPKLELSALAREGTKLLKTTAKDLDISTNLLFGWTDSTVVLGRLSRSKDHWKPFVTARVDEIVSFLPSTHWRHIPSGDNPADHLFRGLIPENIVRCSLLWDGPSWLHLPPSSWPSQMSAQIPKDLPEAKVNVNLMQATNVSNPLLKLYSSLHKLVRITSWIYRFYLNLKSPTSRCLQSTLQPDEISSAMIRITIIAQSEAFLGVLSKLSVKAAVTHSKYLASLHLFLDGEGVARVGGRLAHSNLSYNAQHPVLLHGTSKLARLLVLQRHLDTHHPGVTNLLGLISQEYHIIGLHRLVKSVSQQCVTCRRSYQRTSSQLMGQLPKERIDKSNSFPFQAVGIDFAGPFLVKQGHTRKPVKVEAYVSIFVCLKTKALHLELCLDFSTKTFLGALERFTNQRGLPSSIFTDNSKNFEGAAREIGEVYRLFQSADFQQMVSRLYSTHWIEWHFMPARAPHFGGLWEAGVKLMKTQLRKILPEYFLTYEEFYTFLSHVEATLNSRPLIQEDACSIKEDLMLTPGHFLVGRPLLALPQKIVGSDNSSLLKRWKKIRYLSQTFWSRWSMLYLQSLQARNKWRSSQPNLKEGDCIIIRDETVRKTNSPSLRFWPLAVVEKTYPGKDGLVRAVDVRCHGHLYNRDVTRLVKLFSSEEAMSSSSSLVEDVQDHSEQEA